MCFWIKSVLHHDVYRRFHETHFPYSDANAALFLFLTIRAVYADTLSLLCEQKHFQSGNNLLRFFFVTICILCFLFLSRNDSGCSNHSHVFANLMCFKQNHQEYSSQFTFLLLSLFSIYAASYSKTRWSNDTSTGNEELLHNYRHLTRSSQRMDSRVWDRDRDRQTDRPVPWDKVADRKSTTKRSLQVNSCTKKS